jgi:hypothetical protein
MNRLAMIAAVAVAAGAVTVGGALPALAAVPIIKADKAVISPGSSVYLRVSCPETTFVAIVVSALIPRPYKEHIGTPGHVTTATVRVAVGKAAAPGKYTISLICYQGIGNLKTAATVVDVHN